MARWGAGLIVLCSLLAGCDPYRHDDYNHYDFYRAAYGNGPADMGEVCRVKTERQQWQEAVEICTAALSDPAVTKFDRSTIDDYLVAAYSGLEEYDKALGPANDALAIFPNSAESLERRGYVYADMKDYDHAQADFNRAIEVDPRYNRAHRGLAMVYGMQQRFDLASAEIKLALQRDPEDAELYRLRCRFALHRGEVKQAVSDCDHALQLQPAYSLAKVEKGAAQYFAGDYRGAADTLADFMSYQQEEPYGLLWLHLARKRLGIDDAAQLKEQAQRIDSGRWPALIVRYFEGQISLDVLRSAKADPDPKRKGTRQCDIDYFVGESEMAAGRTDEGHRLLEQAMTGCTSGDLMQIGARAALGRL